MECCGLFHRSDISSLSLSVTDIQDVSSDTSSSSSDRSAASVHILTSRKLFCIYFSLVKEVVLQPRRRAPALMDVLGLECFHLSFPSIETF